MPSDALNIYSVGVSTAGKAEIRMAQANPNRHIIATTIDDAGVAATQNLIRQHGFAQQIEVRKEDVSKPLAYSDEEFEYIYARLVLHYLTRQQLEAALSELHRVLKASGVLFVVVRSNENLDATQNATGYDEETGMTIHVTRPNKYISEVRKRFFHNKTSISQFITTAGFHITHTSQYDEQLFHDYSRKISVDHTDNLIELIAVKEKAQTT